MCQLDSGNRNRSVGERLESLHRRAAALDRAVILLKDIIEVLAAPYVVLFENWNWQLTTASRSING
jgi:hypothetical protein